VEQEICNVQISRENFVSHLKIKQIFYLNVTAPVVTFSYYKILVI